MSDTHQTHINAFAQEVEQAYTDAVGAVDTLKAKIDALKAKYEEKLKGTGEDVTSDVETKSSEDESEDKASE